MTVLDFYDIGEEIGQGGMGTVYRGTDTRTETPVAVKVLKSEVVQQDPDLVERFLREGQILRKLNHPNIVQMLDTVEDGDQRLIIMEYVTGGTLRDALNQQGRLPLDNVLAIGLELADALARAHHLKVIHRDIKPGNILLAADGTPRLTDFGVATIEGMPSMTQTGATVGTFAYLSPEACRAEPLDERTDIWSFGVLLYEMLTGTNPFNKDSIATTVTAILNETLPSITAVHPEVPQAVADLISAMLQKDKTERIGSVRLVGVELESIIRGVTERVPFAQKTVKHTADGELSDSMVNYLDEDDSDPYTIRVKTLPSDEEKQSKFSFNIHMTDDDGKSIDLDERDLQDFIQSAKAAHVAARDAYREARCERIQDRRDKKSRKKANRAIAWEETDEKGKKRSFAQAGRAVAWDGDWDDAPDPRKSKAEMDDRPDPRKPKENIEILMPGMDEPAHIRELKSEVDVGPIRVWEGADGESYVKIGPLFQLWDDGKGNTKFDSSFVKFQDTKARSTQVNFSLGWRWVVVLGLILITPGLCCIGLIIGFTSII